MLDRFLNRLVKWSPERFWLYMTLFVVVAMEATSWLLSQAPLCIVDAKDYGEYYQEGACPTFHLFFIVTMTHILEALGHEWINTISTAVIAIFTGTIFLINRKQFRHARQVEQAYLWPGFGKHEPVEGGMRWFITVTNTGRMAGVLKVIRYARITDEEYNAGGYKFDTFTNREDIIPPETGNPGQPTGLDFVIDKPMVCCGWIEFEDIFGQDRRQGWKHRLRLTEDSAGNWSIPFPDCYSAKYRPWEQENAEKKK